MHQRRIASVFLFLSFSVGGAAEAQREVTPEARIFRQFRDGVVTVFGDGGHGSGFIIGPDGLVLTNQHVIAESRYVRVQLDDSVKVAATVLAADPGRDVAVLRIHPTVASRVPALTLAPRRPELAFEGERVLAIGSPLNQTKIVTSGIVSKVEEQAIISDVNINPGNSGGPLLNMDGEVVAINTFGDVSGRAGPGVAGSISIYRVEPVLAEARARMAGAEMPSADRLPVMPRAIFPLHALEQVALEPHWDEGAYDMAKAGGPNRKVSTGNFNIAVLTPPFMYRTEKKLALELARERGKREATAQVTEAESFSPFEDLKSWAQYTGAYAPVVLVQIAPRVGETTGSTVLNVLGAMAAGAAYRGSHKLEFKADLKDVKLLRDEQPVTEIQRGMTFVPLVMSESTYWGHYYGKDLARAGVFVLAPEMFAPTEAGWPQITLLVEDLKRPGDPIEVKLPQRTVERVWADFKAYREQRAADTARRVIN